MSEAPLVPALRREPVADVAASYARYAARELEREGIPMVLALSDARTGAPPRVVDPTALAEGARLARLFDAYEAGMAHEVARAEADPEPDLTGGAPLITVLVVLAEEHLRARDLDGDPGATGGGPA